MKPIIKNENVKPLFESRFVRVYDLQYEPGKHYYDASRRTADRLMAVKSEEEFKESLPDAVSCVVILCADGEEPKLLLSREYRYPAGQFLLSPPAGLIDETDLRADHPLLNAARREIEEETGLVLTDTADFHVINPLLFSTPGMTDESNAFICVVIQVPDFSSLSQAGAVGTECFDGFELFTKAEALETIQRGTDRNGIFFSVFTWASLMYFISDLWKK